MTYPKWFKRHENESVTITRVGSTYVLEWLEERLGRTPTHSEFASAWLWLQTAGVTVDMDAVESAISETLESRPDQ